MGVTWTIIQADARQIPLADKTVQCVVTSPPYWGLRDYGTATWVGGDEGCDHSNGTDRNDSGKREGLLTGGPMPGGVKYFRDVCGKCGATRIDSQIGLEATPEEYVAKIVAVFREVWRVLRDDGTCWVNLGDSYAANNGSGPQGQNGQRASRTFTASTIVKQGNGVKPKDLVGIPWRVAFALQAAGWYLRSDIIWSKPNPMPESVTDRPTKAHEYIFLLTKRERYYFDQDAVREAGVEPDRIRGDRIGHTQRTLAGRPIDRIAEQTLNRNIRTVWEIATQPNSDWVKTYHWERVEVDDTDGDILSIALPNCPVHWDRFALVANALCDEHAAWFLIYNFDKNNHLVREPTAYFSPFEPRLSCWTDLQNSGCSVQRCSASAMLRNSESHKTAHALLTNPSCIVCGKTTLNNTGKLAELVQNDSAVRRLLSNTSPGDLAVHPLVQIGFDSADKSSCCCRLYQGKLKESSHFATFPEEIAKRCIKAGTSEKGCCAECGAPWERVTEKTSLVTIARGSVPSSFRANVGKQWPQQAGISSESKTLGWQPTCKHIDDTGIITPCVVLDPFSGAGTVPLVADKLNRRGIGLELKADYCRMAERRCYDDAPLLTHLSL